MILLIGLVSTQAQETQTLEQKPIIVPIYIGEYFTGNLYLKTPQGQAYWCSYVPQVNDYSCKEFGE